MLFRSDYKGDIVTDIKLIREGDPCPVCGEPVKLARGIEVGQVFKLGIKYSEPMQAIYKDENMKDRFIWMGCYGIGVSRTLSAIVEQHHDDNGIIWPVAVAPYHVIVTVIKPGDETQMKAGEYIYERLQAAGVEVLLDDRNERPGVKFKDADLIGIPVRITVGRGAADGNIEYKLRRDTEKEDIAIEKGIKRAIEIVENEKMIKVD